MKTTAKQNATKNSQTARQMSELKARHIVDVYDSYYAENPFGELSQVYLKSEADKVIAELKDKCNMHDFFWEGCGFKRRGFKNSIEVSEAYDFLEEENAQLKESIAVYQRNEKLDIREIRHQKYKRCLAMAMWCEATALWCYQAACTLPKGFNATLHGKPVMIEPARLFNRQVLLTKWSQRWLKIAEKFKEAK